MKTHIKLCGIAVSSALLAACGSGSSNDPTPPPTLSCDDSIKEHFKPDDLTTVLLVKSYKAGDLLTLEDAKESTPIAENDVCLVKLNVGPGNDGPADAPSTSPGIGIEVWLPTNADQWNERFQAVGGGGWAGGTHGTLTAVGNASAGATAAEAGEVTASTDTGHSVGDGSFAMLPNGEPNTALWKDFAERSLHETAVKGKALAEAYYGKAPRYSYWVGASTGGRQGLNLALNNPEDFDGILAGYPANNWSNFITTELYPQIVIQNDLNGQYLSDEQLEAVSNAAILKCGDVGGVKLGYIPDPESCAYDPAADDDVICATDGGDNGNAAECVTRQQAQAVNKFWYGQTIDGSVPDPAMDNGMRDTLVTNHKWYGLTRGSTLTALASGDSPFPIAADQVALELQDPTISGPWFQNATGNGQDGWKGLSYTKLAEASDRGVQLQEAFGHINTDDPDLSAFRDAGGKILSYYGLADQLIPPQGSMHYYRRVNEAMGGLEQTQEFYRLYFIPGMGHGLYNGTSNPTANPPLPTMDQLYTLLTDWVEKGQAPGERIVISTQATGMFPDVKSRPMCLHPLKAKHDGHGDPNQEASYGCALF